MQDFAKRLKDTLYMKKISQTELSKRTGLDKSLISSYIAGKYKAKSANLFLIAKALNVSEAWLLGYDVPMERETPTITTDGGLDSELMELFSRLTTDEQTLILAQIKGILSNRE